MLPYEIIGSLVVSENIVHIGALLYLAGFLFQNAMILRSLIILKDFVCFLCFYYFYFAPETPLWGGTFWSVMFTVVNAVMIAFLLSRPATATATSEPGCPYFVWNGARLRQVMQKQPALGTALSAVLNKKLAQKVAAAGVLMNTIGIEAPREPTDAAVA